MYSYRYLNTASISQDELKLTKRGLIILDNDFFAALVLLTEKLRLNKNLTSNSHRSFVGKTRKRLEGKGNVFFSLFVFNLHKNTFITVDKRIQ